MAVRTAGLDHVHLHVRDVEAALAAEEVLRLGGELVFVRLSGGEVLGLDGRPPSTRNRAHVGLRLAEGERLDHALVEVSRAGGSVLERGEHAPGRPYAYVADPDGNVLEL